LPPETGSAFTKALAFNFVICLVLKSSFHYILFFFLTGFYSLQAQAQLKVRGRVFDNTRLYTIESVSVESSSGRTTMTDSLGGYELEVRENDSIWFSFLGKPTPKYPVAKMEDMSRFDIALNLAMITKGNMLPNVTVRTKLYKEDSIQNRREYKKAFEFSRPSFGSMTSVTSTGAGIDVQELIRLFQFRKNKSMEKFRERLILEERERFIDHRFNKSLIRELTGLEGEALKEFAKQYRPAYETCLYLSEYDFNLYIKMAGEDFKKKSF
jgi:hypothetical protein